jgi:hypothetical protein
MGVVTPSPLGKKKKVSIYKIDDCDFNTHKCDFPRQQSVITTHTIVNLKLTSVMTTRSSVI